MDNAGLIRAALAVRRQAYAPYSDYLVGAALSTDDGSIVCGCNVENASYGLCNCAERTAVFKAVSEGKSGFGAIAVVGGLRNETGLSGFAFPCGACRQVLREFCTPDKFKVIVARSEEDYREYTLEELLPDSFGPASLDEQS